MDYFHGQYLSASGLTKHNLKQRIATIGSMLSAAATLFTVLMSLDIQSLEILEKCKYEAALTRLV